MREVKIIDMIAMTAMTQSSCERKARVSLQEECQECAAICDYHQWPFINGMIDKSALFLVRLFQF
jgi:hypothetical protein